MAKDARKQQKKLERKRKKQKDEKRELARQRNQGIAVQMQSAAAAPILHCCVAADLQHEGLGHVLISRRWGPQIACAVFLVDRYCLGVKNCFGHIMAASEYRERIHDRLQHRFQMESIDVETAFLIVQGSVNYARQFSLTPHGDYRKLLPIFGTPDVTGREPPIEFGEDGKPFYIRGPNETPEESRSIIALLRDACGDDGFHYLLLANDLGEADLVETMDEADVSPQLGLPNPRMAGIPGR